MNDTSEMTKNKKPKHTKYQDAIVVDLIRSRIPTKTPYVPKKAPDFFCSAGTSDQPFLH